MSYNLFLLRRAQKELAQLPTDAYHRVGDYRVIYEIDDSLRQVTVLDIGNRRDIYR